MTGEQAAKQPSSKQIREALHELRNAIGVMLTTGDCLARVSDESDERDRLRLLHEDGGRQARRLLDRLQALLGEA